MKIEDCRGAYGLNWGIFRGGMIKVNILIAVLCLILGLWIAIDGGFTNIILGAIIIILGLAICVILENWREE